MNYSKPVVLSPHPDPLPKVIIYLTHQLYPLSLFVIPDSCDFVVWFPFIHRQIKPRRNTNTKPIHTKAAGRMSQVYYCRLNGFPSPPDTPDHPAQKARCE